MKSKVTLFLLVALTAATYCSRCVADEISGSEIKTRITALSEIKLKPGLNDVQFFADGLQGLVGFHGNTAISVRPKWKILLLESAYGGRDFHLVFIPIEIDSPGSEWEVIHAEYEALNANHGLEGFSPESITDSPLEGSAGLRSIRFFNGALDGKQATFLIIGERDLSHDSKTQPKPTPVRMTVLRFLRGEDDPAGKFVPLATFMASDRYCKAYWAVQKEMGLRMDSYTKATRADRCSGSIEY
jgi:hypothetical protein